MSVCWYILLQHDQRLLIYWYFSDYPSQLPWLSSSGHTLRRAWLPGKSMWATSLTQFAYWYRSAVWVSSYHWLPWCTISMYEYLGHTYVRTWPPQCGCDCLVSSLWRRLRDFLTSTFLFAVLVQWCFGDQTHWAAHSLAYWTNGPYKSWHKLPTWLITHYYWDLTIDPLNSRKGASYRSMQW